MNIFVLTTGRSGSTTFFEACRHIKNYTSAHESQVGSIGKSRLSYPKNHIEIDNRLSWFLGRLDKVYGDDAIYVHLKRNNEKIASSFEKRWDFDGGIIRAYRKGILQGLPTWVDTYLCCLDYCDTVDSNIESFLKDKSYTINFYLENGKEEFPKFIDYINAEADIEKAISCFDNKYNSSNHPTEGVQVNNLPKKYSKKIVRIIRKLPEFIASV